MSSARIWISWMRWINCWPFRVLPGQLPFIFMPPRKSFRRKNCLAHRPLVTYSPWPLRHSSSVFFLPRVFCFEPFFFHANKNQHILFSWHVGSGGVPFFFLKKNPPKWSEIFSIHVCLQFLGPGCGSTRKKKTAKQRGGPSFSESSSPVLCGLLKKWTSEMVEMVWIYCGDGMGVFEIVLPSPKN